MPKRLPSVVPLNRDAPNEDAPDPDRPNAEPPKRLPSKLDMAREGEIAEDRVPIEPRPSEFMRALPAPVERPNAPADPSEWKPLEPPAPAPRAPPNEFHDPFAAPAPRADPAPDDPPEFLPAKD